MEKDTNVKLTASIEIAATPEIDGTDVAKQAKGLDYGEVEVIVSNSALDRHGQSIKVEGIDLSQVRKNPVVLWAHEYSGLPIGQIQKLWKSDGNLFARIKLAYDIYDFADTVYKMILRGVINAVSIGGLVNEWGKTKDGQTDYDVIAKLEMIEVSFVPVGAHPDALVTAKSLDMEQSTLVEQYEEFVHKALIDKLEVLPHNEIDDHIKALKSLTSALEATSADPETPTKDVKKLVLMRSTAKQLDKQSELIIAAINRKLNS